MVQKQIGSTNITRDVRKQTEAALADHGHPLAELRPSPVGGRNSAKPRRSIASDHRSKLGFVSTLALLALGACIAPPPKPVDAGVKEEKKEIDFVPVKPTGPLIWAGENRIIKNIDPPGSWFILNDGGAKGKMIPATTEEFDAAIVGSAIHTEGSGYSNWGGGIGFNLAAGDVQIGVDAKAYKGISFKAKGKGFIHFAVATVATMPEFGACTTKCYDHYATDVRLSEEEKEYVFTWEQLKQGGWGSPKAKMDTGALTGMFFTSKGPAAWNITVGDIKFAE